jgi:hypothetical protein
MIDNPKQHQYNGDFGESHGPYAELSDPEILPKKYNKYVDLALVDEN